MLARQRLVGLLLEAYGKGAGFRHAYSRTLPANVCGGSRFSPLFIDMGTGTHVTHFCQGVLLCPIPVSSLDASSHAVPAGAAGGGENDEIVLSLCSLRLCIGRLFISQGLSRTVSCRGILAALGDMRRASVRCTAMQRAGHQKFLDLRGSVGNCSSRANNSSCHHDILFLRNPAPHPFLCHTFFRRVNGTGTPQKRDISLSFPPLSQALAIIALASSDSITRARSVRRRRRGCPPQPLSLSLKRGR